ncbi:hypothetical protein [Tsukamurella pseudospumae]|uniref:Helix-turn-helix domain-containing protein n=1 Tax=Tsukamurella pseudospumae TaxID=239498 RepID=A0A138AU15_9ACTN|nr:hypothetical protein [Tsukamurella pseudospumae]KXP13924.1 hypothetical protein AXK60_22740 [Tsukamurella pseudospumae]
MSHDDNLTTSQLARMGGVSTMTVYRDVREGLLTPVVGTGGGTALRFLPEIAADWLRARPAPRAPRAARAQRPTTRAGRERTRVLVGELVGPADDDAAMNEEL